MGKLIVFVLGLAVVAGTMWWVLKGTTTPLSQVEAAPNVPTRQLERTREAVRQIEQDEQRRLDDIEKSTAQ